MSQRREAANQRYSSILVGLGAFVAALLRFGDGGFPATRDALGERTRDVGDLFLLVCRDSILPSAQTPESSKHSTSWKKS